MYRHVLEQKEQGTGYRGGRTVFAQLYMSLIEMRFEDKHRLWGPTNALQPRNQGGAIVPKLLLENAVKHKQVTPQNKLHIRIYEEKRQLSGEEQPPAQNGSKRKQ